MLSFLLVADMAPEVYKFHHGTEKVDIFSAGVVLCNLVRVLLYIHLPALICGTQLDSRYDIPNWRTVDVDNWITKMRLFYIYHNFQF